MANRPRKTKILLDGGDAGETQRTKKLIGFLDGQTTNPSLIARNPEVKRLVASEHGLSVREQMAEYRKIVEAISPLVGEAGVNSFSSKCTRGRRKLGWPHSLASSTGSGTFAKFAATRLAQSFVSSLAATDFGGSFGSRIFAPVQ
jgi:hypothetical protein